MAISLPFKCNESLSMGIELELQLVDLHNFNLIMEAEDFLRRLSEVSHSGEIKPEITRQLIELNSSVHLSYTSLLNEMCTIKEILLEEANQTHIGVCGGGGASFSKMETATHFSNSAFHGFIRTIWLFS